MIDSFEDPQRAGMSIAAQRDDRSERRAALRAGVIADRRSHRGTLHKLPSMPPTLPPGVLAREASATESVPDAPVAPPRGSAYQIGYWRFGVVGALLVVLVVLWMRERRGGR